MTLKKTLLFCISIFSFCLYAIAQNKVTGTITDTANNPLANVSVVAGKNGTYTNTEGKFILNVNNSTVTIEVSRVGFTTQKIKLVAPNDLKIVLQYAQTNNLNEVVVVGVQTQTKRNTLAAISGITSKDIENRPVASVDILLQGRVSGLNVQVASGEPGVAPTVVVRGNSNVSRNIRDVSVAQSAAVSGPLYVIDGIPMDPADLANNGMNATGSNYIAGINVNDIADVQVQKDAIATAAWGSRGANGVIYITTKKGNSRKPVFDVNVYAGITQRPKLLKTLTGAAERQAKMDLIRSYNPTPQQLAGLPQLLTDSLNPYFNNTTDWQGLQYRNGALKNAEISMSAVNDVVNYRVSAGYFNEDGIIKNTGAQRYTLRGNFGFTINPKLNSQLVVGLSKLERQRGMKINNSDNNILFSGSGQPTSFYLLGNFDRANILGQSSSLRNENTDNSYTANLTVNYSILPWLKYTVQGTASITNMAQDYFSPSNIDAAMAQNDPEIPQPSIVSSHKSEYASYMWMNNLFADKIFETKSGNTHSLTATLSHQYSTQKITSITASANNTANNNVQVVTGISPIDYINVNSQYSRDALLSVLAQVQYAYNKKYLLYGSYRGDASSRFGVNNKWGYFPAAGVGWIVSDEKFMNRLKHVVDFFKIRISYGQAGMTAPGFYAPYNSYNLSGTYNGIRAVQPSYRNGLTKSDLTWQKSVQKDLGFDLELFNRRAIVTVDIYDRLTKNGIYDFALPFYTGYSSVQFNAADLWVNNKGVDISIQTRNLSPVSKVQWNTQFIFSYNKNLLAKLPNNNRTFTEVDGYGISRIYAVGQPIYEFYQVKYLGVYNNTSQLPFNQFTGNVLTYYNGSHPVKVGDPIWLDASGDGDVWSGTDNVPTGNPNPKFTGGFSNDISYKNFTLSITSVFTWKRTVVNTYLQQQLNNMFNNGINGFAASRLPDLSNINYWNPGKAAANHNYTANFSALNPLGGYYYQYYPFVSTFNVDGSYFKIKMVNLSYMLPKRFSDRLHLNRVNIYANATNLLILKNKNNTMPDPELVDQTGVYTGGLYPQPKLFTFGANVQF